MQFSISNAIQEVYYFSKIFETLNFQHPQRVNRVVQASKQSLTRECIGCLELCLQSLDDFHFRLDSGGVNEATTNLVGLNEGETCLIGSSASC